MVTSGHDCGFSLPRMEAARPQSRPATGLTGGFPPDVHPDAHDAPLTIESGPGQGLDPGDEVLVRLHPLAPALWPPTAPGLRLILLEGSRRDRPRRNHRGSPCGQLVRLPPLGSTDSPANARRCDAPRLGIPCRLATD